MRRIGQCCGLPSEGYLVRLQGPRSTADLNCTPKKRQLSRYFFFSRSIQAITADTLKHKMRKKYNQKGSHLEAQGTKQPLTTNLDIPICFKPEDSTFLIQQGMFDRPKSEKALPGIWTRGEEDEGHGNKIGCGSDVGKRGTRSRKQPQSIIKEVFLASSPLAQFSAQTVKSSF